MNRSQTRFAACALALAALTSCGTPAPSGPVVPAPTAPLPRAGIQGSCLGGETSESCTERLSLWAQFQTSGDASLCDKMPADDAAGCRNAAALRAAREAKDPSKCDAFPAKSPDRDVCITEVAVTAGNAAWCAKLEDRMMRERCEGFFPAKGK